MFKITKKFKFEMAHRLVSSYSKKCQLIHGHSYKMELTLMSKELNEDGMVVDFGELKDLFAKTIDKLDHAVVINAKDEILCRKNLPGTILVPYNPTAENMAQDICIQIVKELKWKGKFKHIFGISVALWETESGKAEFFANLDEVEV